MANQTSINPATGGVIREYAEHSPEQVQAIIAKAHACFLKWSQVPVAERAKLLLKAADILLAKKNEFARVISEEMGKPLKEAVNEIEKCAACAKYFAENGPIFLADRAVATEYRKSYVA